MNKQLPAITPCNQSVIITTATNLEIIMQTKIMKSEIQKACSSTSTD